MKVLLARVGDPLLDRPVDAFAALHAVDRIGTHAVTSVPEEADALLFVQCHMLASDWRLTRIANQPSASRFPEKVRVYDERDRPWCRYPGVYVSMPRRTFDACFQRAWGYYRIPGGASPVPEPDLLFSFVGSPTHPSRAPLFRLRHPDAAVERVRGYTFYSDTASASSARSRFQEILARSRFVLCPRGKGTSSIRLYEALGAGRVPVIVSDAWVAPSGPDWSAFSIRWPEGVTDGLIETLEARDADWPRMSRAAVRAYADFFAEDVSFHRIVDLCCGLEEAGVGSRFPRGGIRGRAFLGAGVDQARSRARAAAREQLGRSRRRARRAG